jgi:hypothetical protein
MTAREEILTHLWKEVINLHYSDASLDNVIAHCGRNPTGPLATRDEPTNGYWRLGPQDATCVSLCAAPPTMQYLAHSTC